MGSLNQSFAALADPTRLGIVVHLARSEATVSELVDQFSLTQPTITSHLNVLEKAGLISRTRVAQTRVCRLRADELERIGDWLSQLQSVFEGNYRRLDKLLLELNQPETEKKK
ncbi:MAG: winged helix-turn-helix transcriptional regulator [Planctomycetales bacterium]|nr:winged helix-turn-helix transcriptional regulator [Planctomycetales bacterium]